MLLLSYSYHSNDFLILPHFISHTFMKLDCPAFKNRSANFINSNLCHPDFFTSRLGEYFRWPGIPDRLERCPPTYLGCLGTLHLNYPGQFGHRDAVVLGIPYDKHGFSLLCHSRATSMLETKYFGDIRNDIDKPSQYLMSLTTHVINITVALRSSSAT